MDYINVKQAAVKRLDRYDILCNNFTDRLILSFFRTIKRIRVTKAVTPLSAE